MGPRPSAVVAALALGACQGGTPDGEAATSEAELAAQIVLDQEQEADVPVIGGIGTASHEVQIAWSGTRYLAVWRQDGIGIRFARIAADGTALDTSSAFLTYGSTPTVAFFGGFLVAIDEGDVVELWRVGQQGSVSRIGYVGASNRGKLPDIAAGTGEAMIAFTDDGLSDGRIFAARYDGTAVSPVVQLGTGANRNGRSHIAYQPGGDYLVVWESAQGDVRGRLLSPAGQAGTAMTISNAADPEDAPAVAFAGASFAVVWRATVAGGVQIRGALVSPTGEVGPPVDVSSVMTFAGTPSITCDAGCTVLWSGEPNPERAQLWGRRLDADLAPLGAEHVVMGGPGAQGEAELAGPPEDQFLVWLDDRSGIVEAYGTTATVGSAEVETGEPTILPIGENTQESPAVAASSGSWLVAWGDSRNGGSDLFGRRFGFDGTPRTGAARPIHEGDWIQRMVAVAGNESGFLAAWFHDEPRPARGLRATRLARNGAVLDPDGIPLGLTGLASGVDVAAGSGGSWLVAWERDTQMDDRVHAALVRPDGTATAPLDLTFVLGKPAVAYDPEADVYLVIWSQTVTASTRLIRAVRVAADGSAVLDPAPLTLATLSTYPDADLAFGAGVFLVALVEDDRVYGLRAAIGPSGIEVLDPAPFPLDPAPGRQGRPTITFTARGFLVAYERFDLLGTNDIYGVQIAPTGVPGGAFALVDGPEPDMQPVLAGASQGRALLAFARLEPRDPNDILPGFRSRIFVRRLVVGFPDGATCTSGSQCESGFCADGRCCDQACGDGATGDCQACSLAAGATADGVCTLLGSSSICRKRADTFCDLAERCDEVSTVCPADVGVREGEVCDPGCGAVCPLDDESGSPHVCPVCP